MRTLANTGIFCRCITVHAFSRLMGWVHNIKPWIVVVARTDRSWRVSNEIIKLWSVEFPLGLDTRGLTVRPRRHSTSLSVSHSMREISLMAKARGTITSTELSELGAGTRSGSTRRRAESPSRRARARHCGRRSAGGSKPTVLSTVTAVPVPRQSLTVTVAAAGPRRTQKSSSSSSWRAWVTVTPSLSPGPGPTESHSRAGSPSTATVTDGRHRYAIRPEP
jgi:hypothetical protein